MFDYVFILTEISFNFKLNILSKGQANNSDLDLDLIPLSDLTLAVGENDNHLVWEVFGNDRHTKPVTYEMI